MRKQMVAVLCATAAGALLAGCGDDDNAALAATDERAAPERPTLRFAVTEMKGLEQLQREFGAFQDALEEAADVDLELFPVSDRAAAAVALAADRVDMVFTGPAEYVVLQARTEAEPVVAIRRPGYSSCIWTTTGSGITELADLAGEAVAMEDIGSTSAHLGPAQMLADAGLDLDDDVEVNFVGGAMQEALIRGDVAAVGAGCHDYDEFMDAADDAEEFTLLERGDQLPDDVIAARPGLDEAIIDRVRSAFDDAWPQLREAMVEGEENEKFAEASLVALPDDSDYDIVRSMYRTVGVEDFTQFIGD